MKRYFLMASIFVTMFLFLFVVGCGGNENCFCGCDTLTVEAFDKESCEDAVSIGEYELSGCHIQNSCIDCYWFPTVCGYYRNDLGGVSCVRCGFDCTFLEFYGNKATESYQETTNFDMETRGRVTATLGQHYTVDSIVTRVNYGDYEDFTDGKFNMDDLVSLIKGISMMGDEIKMIVTVQYTALTELSSIRIENDITYSGYQHKNYVDGFYGFDGNSPSSSSALKSMNIQPGKHVFTAEISLNMYELLSLEAMSDYRIAAVVYTEG